MMKLSLGHSWEVISCLLADQEILRLRLSELSSAEVTFEERRENFEEFLPAFIAHTRAEEEVLLARALEMEETRVMAMAALEEHEIAEIVIDRAKHAAHAEQLEARLRVLSDLLEHHGKRKERELYPELRARLNVVERDEMGMRYREAKERNELAPVFQMLPRESLLKSQTGRIGYIIAWLLGVPVWVLLLVFLIRGH
ncbi:MAG: hypothetical protein ACXVB9_08150 [Bdellovibrionota bacterium]